MPHRLTWAAALLLSGLTLGVEFAHVLEWAPKDGYDGALYTHLQESLYVWFGFVGAAVYVLAIAATVALAVLVRHDTVTRRPAQGAAGLAVLALASFLAIIYPVNQRFPVHGGGAVPDGWQSLRDRWETGHAVGFALFLAVFVLLLVALLRARGTPDAHQASRRTGGATLGATTHSTTL